MVGGAAVTKLCRYSSTTRDQAGDLGWAFDQLQVRWYAPFMASPPGLGTGDTSMVITGILRLAPCFAILLVATTGRADSRIERDGVVPVVGIGALGPYVYHLR